MTEPVQVPGHCRSVVVLVLHELSNQLRAHSALAHEAVKSDHTTGVRQGYDAAADLVEKRITAV